MPAASELRRVRADVLGVGPDVIQAFADADDVAHHGSELRRRAGNIVPIILHAVEQVHQQ